MGCRDVDDLHGQKGLEEADGSERQRDRGQDLQRLERERHLRDSEARQRRRQGPELGAQAVVAEGPGMRLVAGS